MRMIVHRYYVLMHKRDLTISKYLGLHLIQAVTCTSPGNRKTNMKMDVAIFCS